ncbi:MAG: hypothetical protein MJB14_09000 [Spirochaetes bacterium]|nr:hypothetical protein [Spirochaetota bacterium]
MTNLPHWQLDNIYQGFDDPKYLENKEKLKKLFKQFEEKQMKNNSKTQKSG